MELIHVEMEPRYPAWLERDSDRLAISDLRKGDPLGSGIDPVTAASLATLFTAVNKSGRSAASPEQHCLTS